MLIHNLKFQAVEFFGSGWPKKTVLIFERADAEDDWPADSAIKLRIASSRTGISKGFSIMAFTRKPEARRYWCDLAVIRITGTAGWAF